MIRGFEWFGHRARLVLGDGLAMTTCPFLIALWLAALAADGLAVDLDDSDLAALAEACLGRFPPTARA